MFEGPVGKALMIEQGYVPPTCTMPEENAGLLIYAEISSGRDPCAGCNGDRAVCRGRPKTELDYPIAHFEPATNSIGFVPPEPPPRPYRRDRLDETDYDQVIFVDRDGTETETIRKRISDEWILEDGTTLEDENRGFERLVAIRLRRSDDV